VTVLRYSTDQSAGLYLTLAHLDEFDGQTVQPVPPGERRSLDDVGPPSWLGAAVARTEISTRIELENVRTRWVPIPSAPVSLTGLAGEWLVAEDGITVQSSEGVLREGAYTVRSLDAQPSAAQLESAGVSATGLEAYRALPQLDPMVAETAREVVDAADATSPYAQALALQRFFTGAEFAYSEEAPVEGGYDGSGADIVATFLQVRAGYCVHFASAMTLMARTLGIPARIAVGFQPGTESTETPGVYVVSSDDLHAWPELHFDGIGWVRFEPTPTRGNLPGYAGAATPDEGEGVEQTDDVPAEAEEPAPGEEEPSAPEGTVEEPSGIPDLIDGGDAQAGGESPARNTVDARALALAALAVIALALVAPGVWRAVRRSRRRRSRDPVERWREVRDTARDLGLPAETTRTPRALAALWSAAVTDLDASLAPVLDAVEKRAFTARGAGEDQEPPAIREVLHRMRDAVPWWRRAAAVVAPVSLLDRARAAEGEQSPAEPR
jgi:transglutaminase-like putative cysteine protease